MLAPAGFKPFTPSCFHFDSLVKLQGCLYYYGTSIVYFTYSYCVTSRELSPKHVSRTPGDEIGYRPDEFACHFTLLLINIIQYCTTRVFSVSQLLICFVSWFYRGTKCCCIWHGQRNTEQTQLGSNEGTLPPLPPPPPPM